MRHSIDWLCAALLLTFVSPAAGAQTAPANVQIPPPPSAAVEVPTTDSTVRAVFENGFRLYTADGRNELRLLASAHLDSRGYFGDSVAPSSFDIRRARLDVRGTLNGFMSLRIQAAMENSPYIRNAWLDMRASDRLHLRVGQMKVAFSTAWLTRDNQVNFMERGTARPVYTFFDRGILLWGELLSGKLTYNLGAYTGVGVDVDATRGDIDDHKDVALRLFAQPFRDLEAIWARRLYVAAQATYGAASVPTRRFETGGLRSANYESRQWRWRTEQMIGSNGRSNDQLSGEVDSRSRWGAEIHYLGGPFTASVEWLKVSYGDITVSHDYWRGSSRLLHEPVLVRDGDVTSLSGWVSLFLTGEHKQISNFGWRQPDPIEPYEPGQGGSGAWELLARYSVTKTDDGLFDVVPVPGFTADQLAPFGAVAVGSGESVKAAVLQGAREVREVSIGVNWIVNHNLRLQLDFVSQWAPRFVAGTDGIVSGGNSNLADRTEKNTLVEREHMAGLRFIFRI